MARMLIHAGFHKTGTTSVQRILDHNRELLLPALRIVLRKDIEAACDAARTYSISRRPEDLIRFSEEIAGFVATLNLEDRRDICLSCEDLSGVIPGRRNVQRYDAAPMLMKALLMTLDHYGDGALEPTFYFSLRQRESWLQSCHTQHLRVIRMEMDTEQYARAYADSADLEQIVAQITEAVAPYRVGFGYMEEHRGRPLGLLEPLLDRVRVPDAMRRDIKMLPPANVSMPLELRRIFLEINRSNLPGDDLKAAKAEARTRWREARSQGRP